MVVLDIPVRPNQNGLFHLIFNQNFQNFGLNGKLPMLKVPWLNVWGFSDRVLFLCQYLAYLAWTSLQTTSFAWFDWAVFRSKDIALKKRRKGKTKRCSQSLECQHYSPFAHLVCSPKTFAWALPLISPRKTSITRSRVLIKCWQPAKKTGCLEFFFFFLGGGGGGGRVKQESVSLKLPTVLWEPRKRNEKQRLRKTLWGANMMYYGGCANGE